MKSHFTFYFCLLAFISNAQGFQNPGGLLIPTQEMSNATIEPRIAPGSIPTLPSKVDLSRRTPFPGNQGLTQGSCSAWAVAYGLKGYQEAVEGNYFFRDPNNMRPDQLFSPAFLFNQIHNPNQTCETGVFLIDVLDKLRSDGAAKLSDMAYDPNDCRKLPGTLVKLSARQYAINIHYTLYNHWKVGSSFNLQEIKNQLAKGYPIVVGMHLDNNFINDSFTSEFIEGKVVKVWRNFSQNNPPLSNACNCYHAMLCIGYDDISGTFKLLNSWGPGRSNEGYIFVSYSAFQESLKEAYYAEDKPNMQPIQLISNFINTNDATTNKIDKKAFIKMGLSDLPSIQRDLKDVNKNYFVEFKLDSGYSSSYKEIKVSLLNIDSTRTATVELSDKSLNKILGTLKIKEGEQFIFDYNKSIYSLSTSENKKNKDKNNKDRILTISLLKVEPY